jgi:hypothetical protein
LADRQEHISLQPPGISFKGLSGSQLVQGSYRRHLEALRVYQCPCAFSMRISLWVSWRAEHFADVTCPISREGSVYVKASHIAMSLIVDADAEGS